MTVQRLLVGLLAVQVLASVVTWWPEPEGPAPTPLVPFPLEELTEVRIESLSTRARGADLVLQRQAGEWVLHSAHDFPTVDGTVDDMLERFAGLSYRRPLATKAIRHQQLNVPDDRPTRRITLKAGDREHVLLLGAASGRRMNVRVAGDDTVYGVEGMGAWHMADDNLHYLDRNPFRLDRSQLQSVRLQRDDTDFELVNRGDGWALADLQPDEVQDDATVDLLLGEITSLALANPADPANVRDEPLVTVSWTTTRGDTGRYEVVGTELDSLVVKVPDVPPFKMATLLTQRALMESTRADFLHSGEDDVPEEL